MSGSLRHGTDRDLPEAGGDPTALSPPVSSHYSHITPHCGRTRTLLTTVCSWQGASAAAADGVNYVDGRQADLTHMHRRGRRGGERHLCPHVLYAPARPCGSHLLSRRRAGRRSVWMVRSGRKGAAQHAAYCRRVSVCEPDCMRVPSQGPHGGGAVRCYTDNGPMRHAFCTRVRCGIRK